MKLHFIQCRSLLVSIVLLLGVCSHVASAQQADPLQFRWSFIGASPGKMGVKIFPFVKDTVMSTGDSLGFIFEPQNECYVYLFLHDSQGEVSVVFPGSEEAMGQPLQKVERYVVPEQGGGLVLDESRGSETFYLLVSPTRLQNVEDGYRKARAAEKDARTKNTKAFLNGLKTLLKESSTSKFGSTPEAPPSLAGSVRGLYHGIQEALNDVEFANKPIIVQPKRTYAKKIVIKHR